MRSYVELAQQMTRREMHFYQLGRQQAQEAHYDAIMAEYARREALPKWRKVLHKLWLRLR